MKKLVYLNAIFATICTVIALLNSSSFCTVVVLAEYGITIIMGAVIIFRESSIKETFLKWIVIGVYALPFVLIQSRSVLNMVMYGILTNASCVAVLILLWISSVICTNQRKAA